MSNTFRILALLALVAPAACAPTHQQHASHCNWPALDNPAAMDRLMNASIGGAPAVLTVNGCGGVAPRV